MAISVPITSFRGHLDSVNACTFVSSDLLISGSCDGEFRIWNVTSRRCLMVKKAHIEPILSLQRVYSSDDIHSFISHSRDGKLNVWDMNSLSSAASTPVLSLFHGSRHFCNASTCATVPNIVITSSSDETQILMHDLRSGGIVNTITQEGNNNNKWGMVNSLLLDSPNASCSHPRLFSGYEDGSIALYDFRHSKLPLCSEKLHSLPVLSMDVCQHKDKHVVSILTGSADNSLVLSTLDCTGNDNDINIEADSSKEPMASTLKTISTEPVNIPQPLICANPSEHSTHTKKSSLTEALRSSKPLEQQVAFGNNTNLSNIYSSSTSIKEKHRHNISQEGTSSVCFRSDGRIFVSGHWDNSVRVFETKSAKPLAILNHHRSSVFSVCFAPSGENAGLFASGSKDGTIALWDLYASKIKK